MPAQEETTIVVIANDEASRQSIARAFDSPECCLLPLAALGDLLPVLHEVPVHGIIVELITSVKATEREKSETFHIMQLFPHLKVKVLDGEVRVMGRRITPGSFLREVCREFRSRTIRKNDRASRHIGVEICRDPSFQTAERAFTFNISTRGCFICSVHSWQAGERVWLRFAGFDHVVSGVVRWWQSWGTSRLVPGIGVEFDALPKELRIPFAGFWL